MSVVTDPSSPASRVAAYRLASLLADRHDDEAIAVLSTADTTEMCLVLARAFAAELWRLDPRGYRDTLRRMADRELAVWAKDLA